MFWLVLCCQDRKLLLAHAFRLMTVVQVVNVDSMKLLSCETNRHSWRKAWACTHNVMCSKYRLMLYIFTQQPNKLTRFYRKKFLYSGLLDYAAVPMFAFSVPDYASFYCLQYCTLLCPCLNACLLHRCHSQPGQWVVQLRSLSLQDSAT